MCQLAKLCSTDWNEGKKAWHPAEDELVAAVQIVRSTKPKNEAEACLAAQMVAIHVMQMKVSARALQNDWIEPRSFSIAGKLARTYAMQLETMVKLRGKGSRQRITVRKYAQHEHKHIHLHQGVDENANQPHEPTRARSVEIDAVSQSPRLTSLHGEHEAADRMPKPGSERQDAMSSTRRIAGIRSSLRRA
jgi:pyruvate/2-oxoglutarate dehydrogenase complex dihydrolipoamide acyltransferase (E2) component